jgi:trehalose 6-phosphate phosphatase
MRYLLESWPAVAERLRNARTIALFLDFDGTLAPLRPRPDEAHLPPPVRRVLRRLACRPRLRIWVISGRRQADVDRRVAVPGVPCLGLYGSENGNLPKLDAETCRMVEEARKRLTEGLDPAAGLWIEDKGPTFALHYRGAAPAAIRQGRLVLDAVHGRFSRWLSVTAGDCVWEMIPRQLRGKGEAVRRRLHRLRQGALPVYIGDDTADEAAFRALSHGITVSVGPARQTRAGFHLRNPAEVCRALQRIDREVR